MGPSGDSAFRAGHDPVHGRPVVNGHPHEAQENSASRPGHGSNHGAPAAHGAHLDAPEDVLARLAQELHARIPMTKFLGIHFESFEPGRIVLTAPLGPSLNHRGTAFGPGVFTSAGLAPWLLLVRAAWAERLAVQILLRRCEFAIHRPITHDYRARCDTLPALEADTLRQGGKVRLTATSQVFIDEGEPAATYTAHFTLLGQPASSSGGEGDLALPFPEAWRT
ncbi:YiiD C-terminal domain-containing protein [Corallococcus sp. AS-1-6]|uniref:YiiD C-terminal domain-containing protein n=1 Tax=Corallococcus sp. AS-1-6 TaxID=2874599 RepID=UPI001CBBAD4E|nr:YiiD C-terminal domain-containing protein [Corallococcus sp. AS-1-6]